MVMSNKSEKVLIGIDDQVIELTGDEKETFLADKQILMEAHEKFIADFKAEAEAKAKAKQEIADRLGLTADELQLLLG